MDRISPRKANISWRVTGIQLLNLACSETTLGGLFFSAMHCSAYLLVSRTSTSITLWFSVSRNLNKYSKIDELCAKLIGPVSSWNLGSCKANVPGSTTENHGPLLAGTASLICERQRALYSIKCVLRIFWQTWMHILMNKKIFRRFVNTGSV